jgi:hypothetical protein
MDRLALLGEKKFIGGAKRGVGLGVIHHKVSAFLQPASTHSSAEAAFCPYATGRLIYQKLCKITAE